MTKKFVKKFLSTIILINETKIISTNEKMFTKNFHDIKVFDIVTSKNELTTIDFAMIKNETLTSDEFVKNFRFDIMTTKFCFTTNWLFELKTIDFFDKIINWSNVVKKFRFREKTNILIKKICFLIDWTLDYFRRLKIVVKIFIIFSYSRIKFDTSSNSKMFFYSLYCET